MEINKVIEKPVMVFKQRLFCECGGEMLPTGEANLTAPLQYIHKCNSCGKVEAIHGGIQYPRIEYREKDNPKNLYEWVSIKDELPPYRRVVLLNRQTGDLSTPVLGYYDGEGFKYSIDDLWAEKLINITHWCYIPCSPFYKA